MGYAENDIPLEEVSPWKILVVDDDEDDYFLVCEMLSRTKRYKFNLKWAKTYAEGRSTLLSEIFDAVLMDYDLGAQTGLSLIREMTDRQYPGAFILYTGRGSDEVDIEAMQAGASMYLTKGEVSALMLERGIRYAVERKQYEQTLTAQQAQLEAIFEAQQDVVLLYDPGMYVRRVNQAFKQIYGFDPVGLHIKEVASRVTCRMLDGQPLDWEAQPTPQALQGMKVTGARSRVRAADGSDRVVETSSSPLWLGNKITGSVTVWHDITDLQQARQSIQEANITLQEQAEELEVQSEELRQQTEELIQHIDQLHMSEERFNLALKNMPVTVANVDRNLCYTWIYNPQAGFETEESPGKQVGISTDPVIAGQVRSIILDVINEGIPARWETATYIKTEQRYFLTYAEPLRDRSGSISGAAMVSVDITERKKIEQALVAAQQQAIEEKSRMEAVMQVLPVGVAITDAQGGNIQANPAFEQVWGGAVRPAESVKDYGAYQAWWSDTGKPLTPEEWASAQAVRKGESVLGQIIEIQRFDGSRAVVINSASPVLDVSGQVVGSAVAIQDITKLKRVEESMRANEAALRGFLDATQESIWLFNTDGTILMGNRMALARLKRPAEEVLGHPFGEFMPAHIAKVRQARIDEVVATARPVEFEDQRAGIHFLHSFYPVFDGNGRVTRVAAFSRDITERKLREQELSRLNRILIASNNSGKAMLRAEDEAAYLHEVCQIITDDCGYAMVWVGYAEQDAAKSVRVMAHAGFEAGYLETLKLTWADSARGRGPTGKTIRTGKPNICRDMLNDPSFAPWRDEARKRGYAASIVLPLKESGTTFGALTIYSREVDPFTDSEIELLSGIAVDLAYGISILRLRKAQARAETSLRDYARRLERSNRELENFAFAASHDLQEPLRKIESFSGLIIRQAGGALGETERGYLERMQNASERMRKMIDGLLELSRVMIHGQPFTRVNLDQVAQAVIDDLQIRIQQVGGQVEVGSLPVIMADPIQMHQLLQNLIVNALKFQRPGVPPVVRVCSKAVSGQQVEIRVEDNGVGFDPAQAERIFQPFVRLHGRSVYEGSGMGLAICRQIIERHGGSITASSQPGEGSQFIITLPMFTR